MRMIPIATPNRMGRRLNVSRTTRPVAGSCTGRLMYWSAKPTTNTASSPSAPWANVIQRASATPFIPVGATANEAIGPLKAYPGGGGGASGDGFAACSTLLPSGRISGVRQRLHVVEFFSSDHVQQVGQQTVTAPIRHSSHPARLRDTCEWTVPRT